MHDRQIKKEFWFLLILIVVIAGLIVGIVATKIKEDTPKDTDVSTDIDIQETDYDGKLLDMARIPNFLTHFGEAKVDLSQSAKARFMLIEYATTEIYQVSYDYVDDGYLLRYEKLEDFKNEYEKIFGDFYDFNADLKEHSQEFYDCASVFGEGNYCFKSYFSGDELIFEYMNEPKVNGKDGGYILEGIVDVYINLEKTTKKYRLEYENYYLKNLVVD